jgi:oxygen-independent coproporphyrinogen III oxidase
MPRPPHLYVHIPYCRAKCPYCDFTCATPEKLPPPEDYVNALLRDLESTPGPLPRPGEPHTAGPFSTIFIGGGTPTELPLDQLKRVLEALSAKRVPDCEWTVEANPLTLTREIARALRDAGVNRISLGFQSSSDEVLKRLGRVHRHRDNLESLAIIREMGFPERSGDMIYGLEDDSVDGTLEFLLAADLTHISAYELTIEGTSTWALRTYDPSTSDEDKLEKLHQVRDRLAEAGFRRYEVSNFALPGHECRSHLNVWKAGEYVGVGVSAHGHERGVRYAYTKDAYAYVTSPVRTDERTEEIAAEAMMLGMRLPDGVRWNEWPEEVRRALEAEGARLSRLDEEDYIEVTPERVRPTEKGLKFVNEIGMAFL